MAGPNTFQSGAWTSRFTHHHIVVFLLTFFSYSLLHASRKTFSNVKVSISSQWTPTYLNKTAVKLEPVELWNSSHLFPNAEEATLFLGTLDTIFLFSYAVGLFISGIIGDRFNMRWVLSFGMCSSAVVYAFLLTASVQFAGGIIIFFGLLISPEEIGLPEIEKEESSEDDPCRPLINNESEDHEPNYSIQEVTTIHQPKAISFYQACCLPGVILYSLAYACLKLVNYSFFFWLPFYLSNNFRWKEAEADKLSIWYDVGGIIGGTLQGFISDMLQKRAPVLAGSLLLAIGSLVGYSRSPNNKAINAFLMAVTGFFIGGPSNMISAAISADLGHQELVQGSSEALATVTGIVDGTGSIGAAMGQFLVSLIQDNLGWMWVFYFFILMTSCTILFISPLIVKEIRSLVLRR
ncbi:sugar phosphate exchanger 3 isoform X3 [Gracilinanus agilis]|uniref:sugar phosphate exchanger 3 isoform X3 n=1 Tax=Gracilinanus agilis TaxID=191870 RepID=UPI001CFF4019|nr:sugar phosphate exchanger 3 isoform X3 [Gracilinanus agilis]